MSKSFIGIVGILAVGLVVIVARNEHRDGVLEDAHRASAALISAGEQVQFEWEYEDCPPQNAAVYAEWTRRLADAKASSSMASKEFGADDPNVQLQIQSILNQEIFLSERQLACLKTQGKVLDRIRARR